MLHPTDNALTPEYERILAFMYQDVEARNFQANIDDIAGLLGINRTVAAAFMQDLHRRQLIKLLSTTYILSLDALKYVESHSLADPTLVQRNTRVLAKKLDVFNLPAGGRKDYTAQFRQEFKAEGIDDRVVNSIGEYVYVVLHQAR